MFRRTCAETFLALEIDQSGLIAQFCSLVIVLFIFLAILSYVLSTISPLLYYDNNCSNPVCSNDVSLCPNTSICKPTENPTLLFLEQLCVYFFTAEYGIRLLTCWSVSARLSSTLPWKWERQHTFYDTQPIYSLPIRILKYSLRFKNLVDLASILPYYISFATNTNSTIFIIILRFLRLSVLLRLFRVLKLIKNVNVTIWLI